MSIAGRLRSQESPVRGAPGTARCGRRARLLVRGIYSIVRIGRRRPGLRIPAIAVNQMSTQRIDE